MKQEQQFYTDKEEIHEFNPMNVINAGANDTRVQQNQRQQQQQQRSERERERRNTENHYKRTLIHIIYKVKCGAHC